MSQKRISYIDMAKGIGILLVLVGHSEYPSTNLITWISSFHMPLFFILSGMLLSHVRADAQDFKRSVKKKARTILIPYAIFSVLSIIASAILDFAIFAEYLPNAILQAVSFYGISVLWFLPTLFISEVVFLFLRKHTSYKINIVVNVAVGLLAILANELYHRYYTVTEAPVNLFISYLITVLIRSGIAITFLAIGYYIYRPFSEKKLSAAIYLLLSAGFLVLNLFLGFKNGGVDLNQIVFRNYILYYLAAFCGSMFVICLCNALPDSKALIFLGKNSLIIMVTHMNCRFYGACFIVADLFLRFLPQAGLAGYYIVVAICMFLLEAIAIYVINHYFPFLIGKPANKFQIIK